MNKTNANEINTDGMVVVTSINGEKFLGTLPEGIDDVQMLEYVAGLKPIPLKNVRQLLGQMSPHTNHRGEILGVRTFMALLPYDMFEGPADEVNIIPSTWYFVKGGKIQERVRELILTAERNETVNQAAAAGLEVAGPMPGMDLNRLHQEPK